MFKLLLTRRLPVLIVRLLLDGYTRQELCISWDSCFSRHFNVSNGVKQGGVLSPILFIVYIDKLILLISDSGLGCHIGSHFVGALGYADDLTLVCPTLESLNGMLEICSRFAEEFNVTFNASKTMCIKFGSPVLSTDQARLGHNVIEWVNEVKHLGNIVRNDLSDSSDSAHKCSSFNGAVNKLFASFKGLDSNIMCTLFQSYCCSFYGSQLWDLSSIGFQKFCVQWNKAVRRLLNVSNRTHTWLLGPLSNQTHVSCKLK